MTIQILGDSNQKGALFESLLGEILDKQGYGNFETRVVKPGMELDIIATDNVTGKKILVEAKAHGKEISSSELQKFHSKLITMRNDFIDYGIFWSLSGINNHAKSWYNELDKNTKLFFMIKDGNDFLKMLTDLRIIAHNDFIDEKINTIIKKKLLPKDFVYFKNNWYIIQYFENNLEEKSFVVLDAKGGTVDNLICKEIRELANLKTLKLILLASREQILELLLQHDFLTLNELVEKLKEEFVDVQTTLDELLEQNLIEFTNDSEKKYTIRRGLETFLHITKEFNNNSSILMKSKYLENSITFELISYISNRFFVTLTEEQKSVLGRILLISHSSLEYCLRTDNTPDQNLLQQFGGKIPPKINKTNQTNLFSRLCVQTLNDIEHLHGLGLQNTRGLSVDMNLKLATIDSQYLSVDAKYTQVTMKASGSIKRGEAVSIANPEGFIELSLIHRNLGQMKESIKILQDLLSLYGDEGEWRKAAYINLGMTYDEIGKTSEAMTWLKRATEQFPEVMEGWLNFGNLLLRIGKLDDAKKAFEKALVLSPDYIKIHYGLSRILAAQNKTEECLDKIIDILKTEKQFVNRINEDKEFKKIKKSKEYLKILKELNIKKKYP